MILLNQLETLNDGPMAVMRDVLERLGQGQALARPELAYGHPTPSAQLGLTATGTPRIVICLAGKNHMLVPRGTEIREILLRSMDAVFIPSDSWNLPTHAYQHSFLTLDFNPLHIRYYLHQRQGIQGCDDARILYLRKGALPVSVTQTIGIVEGLLATNGLDCADTAWGLIASLVAQADCALAHEPVAGRTTPEGKWEIVRQYVEDHLPEPLTREDVAAVIDVHPNHLSRLFRRFAGRSYVGHLAQSRLARAAEWLVKYDMPACEIGRLCGYLDATHFSRVFRKHFGVPPKRYQQENKSDAEE